MYKMLYVSKQHMQEVLPPPNPEFTPPPHTENRSTPLYIK